MVWLLGLVSSGSQACAVERAQGRVSDTPVWVQTPIATSSRLHEPHEVTSLSGFISPSLSFSPWNRGPHLLGHGLFRNVTAHQEVSGRKASEASICVYSHSPSLALPPELLLSKFSQWNALESTPMSLGKLSSYKTDPCCQKS